MIFRLTFFVVISLSLFSNFNALYSELNSESISLSVNAYEVFKIKNENEKSLISLNNGFWVLAWYSFVFPSLSDLSKPALDNRFNSILTALVDSPNSFDSSLR